MIKAMTEKDIRQSIVFCTITILCIWGYLFYHTPYHLGYTIIADQYKLILDGPVQIMTIGMYDSQKALAVIKQHNEIAHKIFITNFVCFMVLVYVRNYKKNLQWSTGAIFALHALMGYVFYLIFVTPAKGYPVHMGFSTSHAAAPLIAWLLVQTVRYVYEKLSGKVITFGIFQIILFICISVGLIKFI